MDGTVIDTNLTEPSRRGLAADTIRGEPIAVLLPAAAEGAAWLEKHSASGEEPFESNFSFAPNRTAPAAMTVRTVTGADGAQLGYIVSAHDLSAEKGLAVEHKRRVAATTALRSVEERFSRAFRASPAGMLIVEGGTRIVLDANEAAARIFGADVASIVGICTDDLGFRVAPEDLDPILAQLGRDEAAGAREFTVERADGVSVRCLVAASPLEFGGKQAVVFTIVDVTELDRLRDEFAKAQKLDSIGVLAGGLAHDFNNILTAVLGNISLARLCTEDRREVDEALDRSEAACLRARDLASQLLTFAKGGDPSPEPTDVLELLREAVRMATAGSSVAAMFSTESTLPLAFVDPGQILQAFSNIAINAVQAMGDGGTLSLRTRSVVIGTGTDYSEGGLPADLAEGSYIAVDFQDQGTGIAPELLGRIFDPYVTTKRKGSGLGLAICYSILKRHRGAISVSSELGRGSLFTVYLPAARPDAIRMESGADRERAQGRSSRKPSFGKGAVLLMDDELAIRSTTEKMLNRLGYEPTLCDSGDAAVEAFATAREGGRPFIAVILDLTVPAGMGGVEAAKLIREIDPTVRLFVSSGYAETPVLADYASYGFDGVIAKPYGIEELGHKLAGE
jgi:PAS domain S-box-containing protein